MSKKLKLTLPKEALRGSLRDDAKIWGARRGAGQLSKYATIPKEELGQILADYDKLIKVAKKAGYKIEQPSSVRNIDTKSDKDVPAFLKKDEPKKAPKKKKRVRL